MLKEPEAKQWWVDRDEDDYIVLVIGFDSDGDTVIEDKWNDLESYEMATFLKKFKHEPDCDGFDWKPVPVESPDDWVTQDVVEDRPGIDQWRWVHFDGKATCWSDTIKGTSCFKHGHKLTGSTLEVRCRRKDLPKPAEPKKTRVELRLWVNEFTGEIVHDPSMNTMDDWHEVLFDTTGQPYYLKD